MVIVHLTVLKPEINVIDVKYTLIDKLANFGGNYGNLVVQITFFFEYSIKS